MRFASTHKPRLPHFVLLAFATITSCGCYAPLVSPGVDARDLPEEFRTPVRAYRNRLNLAELTIPKTQGHVGPGDLLSVHVHGLSEDPENPPLQVRVLEDGTIDLPLVGSVSVSGKTLPMVRDELVRTYERGKFLKSAQVSVQMVEAATVQIVVIGEVNTPGVYTMPRNMADVGRALAMAGGMTEFAADAIEVHSNSPGLMEAHNLAPAVPVPTHPVPAPLPANADEVDDVDEVDEPEEMDSPDQMPPPVLPMDDEEVRADEPQRILIRPAKATSKSEIQRIVFEETKSDSTATPSFGFTVPKRSKRKRPSKVQPAVAVVSEPASPSIAEPAFTIQPTSARSQSQATAVAVPLIGQESPTELPEPRTLEPRPVAPAPTIAPPASLGSYTSQLPPGYEAAPYHTCIALAGNDVRPLSREEVRLRDGDVITVPRRKDDVFYVVGPLNSANRTSFNVGTRDLRQLGSGFLLPRDRDIDVVTGVAMAGYIDPINSPTTVSVHRRLDDGRSLLIRVNLIEARYDRLETVMLRPGDIVYLNPDAAWWSRRYFDQVAPDLFSLPWRFWTQEWILGGTRSQGL